MPKKLYTNKHPLIPTFFAKPINRNKVSTTKIHIPIIVITFLILAGFLVMKVVAHNGFIPDWDESNHLLMSFYYYEAFNSKSFSAITDLYQHSNTIYPPLYHVLTSMSFRLVNSWPLAAIITNIPFILILMLSVYGIGGSLGNKRVGLLAAILTPILPIFLTVQEKAAIDYISASVFVFSFYLLFKTDYLTSRKYSILLGITTFSGFLIKWPFVIPSLPFIVYSIVSIFKNRKKLATILINLVIILIITLPALSWYMLNYNDIVSKLGFFWNPDGFAQILWNNPHGLSVNNILLYLVKYPIEESGIGITALAMFFVSLFISRKKTKELYLIASIGITYLVLTFLDDKSSLYMVYVYPLVILVTINAFFDIKNRIIKGAAIAVISVSILINFILTQFDDAKPKQVSFNISPLNKILLLPNYNTKFKYGNWPTEEIVSYIINKDICRGQILVFPDRRFINTPTINFFIVSKGINYATLPAYIYYDPAKDRVFDLNTLDQYSCIISIVGEAGTFANNHVIKQVNDHLITNNDFKVKEFVDPDGGLVLLFSKNSTD